jgi:hypothetical protein
LIGKAQGVARDAPAVARGGLARDAQGDRQLIPERRYLSGPAASFMYSSVR